MFIKKFLHRNSYPGGNFFVYDHWDTDARLVIHKSECKFCDHGQGLHNVGDSE